LEKQENTESAAATRIASQILRRYNEASQFDKQFVLIEQMSRPDVNDAVRRRVQTKLDEKSKGLTSIDRQAKNLTVAKRAEYYKGKIETLAPSQIPLYIEDQIEKGVMSKRVLDIIRDQESFKQFFGQ
jgi:hypothetical protein